MEETLLKDRFNVVVVLQLDRLMELAVVAVEFLEVPLEEAPEGHHVYLLAVRPYDAHFLRRYGVAPRPDGDAGLRRCLRWSFSGHGVRRRRARRWAAGLWLSLAFRLRSREGQRHRVIVLFFEVLGHGTKIE